MVPKVGQVLRCYDITNTYDGFVDIAVIEVAYQPNQYDIKMANSASLLSPASNFSLVRGGPTQDPWPPVQDANCFYELLA